MYSLRKISPLFNSFIKNKLCFTLSKNSFILINGINGSGKSSLLTFINNSYINFENKSLLRKIHLSPSLHKIYNYTILQYILISSLLDEINIHSILFYIIQINIYKKLDCPVIYFSSGQKQMWLLLQYRMYNRFFWTLDEPTSYLDKNYISLLNNIMIEHRNKNGLVFIASHSSFSLFISYFFILNLN